MTAPSALADALTAAALAARDPAGLGGLLVTGGAGQMADALAEDVAAGLPDGAPARRLPLSVDVARLDGALDVAATLAAGRPVLTTGLLAESAGGLLVVPSAERLSPAVAGRIAAAMDRAAATGDIPPLAVVALDEGGPDDPAPPAALADRLAFHVRIGAVPMADVAAALAERPHGQASGPRRRPPDLGDEDIAVLAGIAESLGVASPRVLLQAAAAARAAAILDDREEVAPADVALAARLVIAPRATRLPATVEPPDAPGTGDAPPHEEGEEEGAPSDRPLADRIVEAAIAALPPHILAGLADLAAPRPLGEGRGGPERAGGTGGGRPLPSRPGRPGRGAGIDVLETLRAAAPMQKLRPPPPDGCRIAIRAADLRVRRYRRRTRTTTVFVVDASGSSALHRLGEAKGAVELILADCYVRRDRVAMIAFRGAGADPLLPPTSSLSAARRRLADLPAGGGTPLAAGIDAAVAMAARIRGEDEAVTLVFLTDGQANVARDGTGGRARADADALDAAARLRAAGLPVLLIDISDRPGPRAQRLSTALGARYLPLPRADAGSLAAAVRAGTAGRRNA